MLGCFDQWNGIFREADCHCLPLHCLLSRDPKQPPHPPHSCSGGCILALEQVCIPAPDNPAPVVRAWSDEIKAWPHLRVRRQCWVETGAPQFRLLIWAWSINAFCTPLIDWQECQKQNTRSNLLCFLEGLQRCGAGNLHPTRVFPIVWLINSPPSRLLSPQVKI